MEGPATIGGPQPKRPLQHTSAKGYTSLHKNARKGTIPVMRISPQPTATRAHTNAPTHTHKHTHTFFLRGRTDGESSGRGVRGQEGCDEEGGRPRLTTHTHTHTHTFFEGRTDGRRQVEAIREAEGGKGRGDPGTHLSVGGAKDVGSADIPAGDEQGGGRRPEGRRKRARERASSRATGPAKAGSEERQPRARECQGLHRQRHCARARRNQRR